MELIKKENIDLESIVNKVIENPFEEKLYSYLDKIKDKLKKKINLKEERDLENRFKETLIAFEDFSGNVEEQLEEIEEEFGKGEGNHPLIKNKDIADFFFSKHMEFAGKKGNLLKEYKKIIKNKKIKKLIKSIANSRFYSLMLLINRADPLEVEAILKKLLPALIQAGVGEEGIKKIVNYLIKELDKGRIKGSKEFFRKLNGIISYLNLFGGSNELINFIGE